MKTPDIRPWMAVGLAVIMVSASGCCGGRAGFRFPVRNCNCSCTKVCRPAAVPCKQVPDTACDSRVVAKTIQSEPASKTAQSVLSEKIAKPEVVKQESSRRQNNHRALTDETQFVATPSTGVSTVRDNSSLQSIADPEFIRHLALTPVPPEAPKVVEIIDLDADKESDLLAGTQLLGKPAVREEIPTPAPTPAEPEKPSQPETVATQIANTAIPTPSKKLNPVAEPPVATAQILPVSRLVVLKAVVPDSLMQAQGSAGRITGAQQVQSPMGSGIPVLPASFGPGRGESWNPSTKTQQLPPELWTRPEGMKLHFNEIEPRILKAIPQEYGSGLSGPSVNLNGVEKSANAANILHGETGK